MTKRRRRLRVRDAEVVSSESTLGEPTYRLARLAQQADLSLKTIQRYADKGLINVVKIGPRGVPRVTESEYRRFMKIAKPDDQG